MPSLSPRLVSALMLLAALGTAACANDAAEPQPSKVDGQRSIDTATPPALADNVVHDALTRHPEWLIEMSQALRQKQQAEQETRAREGIARYHTELFNAPADPVVGNADGDVTVVEFFDYQCPFCKKVAPDLKRLYGDDRSVKVVYKEFPILDPASRIAAQAALASRKQWKYEAFHDALMADNTPEHQLTEVRIMQIAKSVGLNPRKLKVDMEAPDVTAAIEANIGLARALGIQGTPGLIIGDKLMPGAVPFEAMERAVADARERGMAARR